MRLLIHTGGTIGMVPGPEGLTPGKGVIESAVMGRARVIAFDPLLDSADVGPAHWNRLLDLIEAESGPVIVTHGTDTLTWTGAALSQALAGWPHPVVLTAAMHPLGAGGDAEGNLELALSATPGPGVWLAFAGQLLPAGGLIKAESTQDDAFRAIDLPPESGAYRHRRFDARRGAVLSLSPGLPARMLEAALAELDIAVLRVFGTGTMPADPALEAALIDARKRGVLLRAVSICENGGLLPGIYAAGQGLWSADVQNGGLDTPEAALIRLWLGPAPTIC